ncbi:STAS domain-containing protein [bacterium]|nr:STAS domain-containing protein [bacterium]
MQVEEKKIGKLVILTFLERRIDAILVSDFKAKLSEVIENGNNLIALDFSEVEFIDSSGLGAIVSCYKIIGKSGLIVICNLKDVVFNMFQLTRMDRVFKVYTSNEEAINELS